MNLKFDSYKTEGFFDEVFAADGQPRNGAAPIVNAINELPINDLLKRQKAAELALLQSGITFNVYGDNEGEEKIFPFDIIPRIVQAKEWERIEKGLKQRIEALNLFVNDVYNSRKIFRDKIIPEELVSGADSFRKQAINLNPPKGIWIHISGSDLIRDEKGDFFVLEDNLRCPSGVSYMLENRAVLKKTFPKAFKTMNVRPINVYPDRLLAALQFLSKKENPVVVVLTPGIYNSAYYEHSFLAQQMGIQLVEGRDLVVLNDTVKMKTTKGFETVDVIYRRIDDDFLDPEEFNPTSLLGIPGIMKAYRKGNVVLANAIGTGVADDKAVYAYTPQIIKYYLGEDPILPILPTYLCSDKKSLDHVLSNLDKLVVKSVNMSGGYGMLIGPMSTQKERASFAELIKEKPRDYIAQPTINLSRAPVICGKNFVGRHVDLRPYVLYGEDINVIPGGLTRVALKAGSLVVNSSQGGGSKDTWILSENGNGGEHAK